MGRCAIWKQMSARLLAGITLQATEMSIHGRIASLAESRIYPLQRLFD
jgi:hypothetical protein